MAKLRVTAPGATKMKKAGQKIVVVTAYDFPMAVLADAAEVDMILVGDSLGMVVLGYESTLPVTLEDMIRHTRAVRRGSGSAFVVVDMPFGSYEASVEQAVLNGIKLIKESGAHAVKLEGGRKMAPMVAALTEAGVPVMGHLGLTPQSTGIFGGYVIQGKTAEAIAKMQQDALALEEAGAFAVVLECVPEAGAALISKALTIPTIGIGAGAGCDGQVLVCYDMLNINQGAKPRFVKEFADVGSLIKKAFKEYGDEVRKGTFPSPAQSYIMVPQEQAKLAKFKKGKQGKSGGE